MSHRDQSPASQIRQTQESPQRVQSPGTQQYRFSNHPTQDMLRLPYRSPYQYKAAANGAGPRTRSPFRAKNVSFDIALPRPPLPGDSTLKQSRSSPWRPGGGIGAVSQPNSATKTSVHTDVIVKPSQSRKSPPKRQISGKFSSRKPFHLPRSPVAAVCTFGVGH